MSTIEQLTPYFIGDRSELRTNKPSQAVDENGRSVDPRFDNTYDTVAIERDAETALGLTSPLRYMELEERFKIAAPWGEMLRVAFEHNDTRPGQVPQVGILLENSGVDQGFVSEWEERGSKTGE